MRKTLDKMEDWANGTLQLTNLSDSDLSNIIVALTKQVPQTPNLWGDGYSDGELVYDMYDCPSCNQFICYEPERDKYSKKMIYCFTCGQKINWQCSKEERI